MHRLDLTEAQAYGDGWDEGREAMLKTLEAIAVHWEREQGGGWERMREGARWLRTAMSKVQQGETYDGCDRQGPDPYEALEFCRNQIRCYYDAAMTAMRTRRDPCPDIFDMAGFELALQRADAVLVTSKEQP